MPKMYVEPKARRSLGLLLPVVTFAALAFGCADESVTSSSDEQEQTEETESPRSSRPTTQQQVEDTTRKGDAGATATAKADASTGATEGDAPDEAPAASGGKDEWPEKCDAVYRLTVDNDGKSPKQKIAAGAETHPQVFVDAPWGNEDVQALAFRPITDNKKVLHHWIAYANTGGFAFMTGWAPGQDETEAGKLPQDVGMYLPKGPRSIRLDMHYYNRQGTTVAEDGSGVEVCVTKTPRKYAATTFMGFAGIPIIAPNAEVDIKGVCNVKVTEPVFLMTVSAHAHQLATHMTFTHKRGDKTTVLWDAPFNFEEQTSTRIENGPLELKTGDVITTVCHFKNTTNKTVTFGENTGNEMCFNFSSYYPRNALSCSGGLGGFGG